MRTSELVILGVPVGRGHTSPDMRKSKWGFLVSVDGNELADGRNNPDYI